MTILFKKLIYQANFYVHGNILGQPQVFNITLMKMILPGGEDF